MIWNMERVSKMRSWPFFYLLLCPHPYQFFSRQKKWSKVVTFSEIYGVIDLFLKRWVMFEIYLIFNPIKIWISWNSPKKLNYKSSLMCRASKVIICFWKVAFSFFKMPNYLVLSISCILLIILVFFLWICLPSFV